MNWQYIEGLTIPFLGTTLGSAAVFLISKRANRLVQRILTALSSGIMVAASIFSLLLPAIESESKLGRLSFLPTVIGFWFGVAFLVIINRIISNICAGKADDTSKKNKTLMMAVTLHNIPEGMAVGVALAGAMHGQSAMKDVAAISLAIGIAIQNIPDGAIVAMPIIASGESNKKAFLMGVLSGAVEPIAAIITILCAKMVTPAMPYFLSFAAGAMMYVVFEELVPEMAESRRRNERAILFSVGFTLMMILDVAL